MVLGHEFVEVVAHGPDCTGDFPVGTRVTAMPILLVDGGLGGTKVIGQHPEAQGSFGELLVVNEMMARAVVGDVSNDAVALVDAFAVGEFYVRSSAIGDGEVAIVVGAEPSGSRRSPRWSRGVDPIVVSDFAGRRELAGQLGARALDPAGSGDFQEIRRSAGSPSRGGLRMRQRPGLIAQIIDVRHADRIFAAGAGTRATPSTAPATHRA
jgi:threonine dehydrogenase-like Zn-dependent dehydrogenase